jgi:hypothetical protein
MKKFNQKKFDKKIFKNIFQKIFRKIFLKKFKQKNLSKLFLTETKFKKKKSENFP